MKLLIQPTMLFFSLVTLCSIFYQVTPSSATEFAIPLVAPKRSDPMHDKLVNPAACRLCRTAPCTCCEPVCCPKRVKEKEAKSCWKVACEYVCVPGYRFPWEKCCGPVRGWVRCVNVLEEHKYTCDTCGYEWDVKYVRTSTDKRRSHCKCPCCQLNCR